MNLKSLDIGKQWGLQWGLQTGVGIEWEGNNLRAVIIRRQFSRLQVTDSFVIPDAKQIGPAECGTRYREFLSKHGLKAPWTVVALPRTAALLRWLSFPLAVGKDLARAVELQLDGLHPFEEGAVYWDTFVWERKGKKPEQEGIGAGTAAGNIHVLVAMAEKRRVEEMAEWFAAAGIGVSQFSPGAALLAGAIWSGKEASGAAGPLLILKCGETPAGFAGELIGCTPGRDFLWKEIQGGGDAAQLRRELDQARSALRAGAEGSLSLVICGKESVMAAEAQDAGFQAPTLREYFPNLAARAADFDWRVHAGALAAAVAAADRKTPFAVNLLPAEKRLYQSPLAYLPTYALSSIVVLLAVALGVRGSLQDWMYARHLDQEIQALQPQITQLEAMQDKGQQAAQRLAALSRFEDGAVLPLEILLELTRLLPPDAWLQQLQLEGDTVAISGLSDSASGLLQVLSASAYFENPQFTSSITRTAEGKENFRIGLRLRAGAGR